MGHHDKKRLGDHPRKGIETMVDTLLAANNPGLITVEQNEMNRLTAACKNIRKQLKAAFPFSKFKVSCKRYSGGDSIRVSWVDGPMSKDVERITNAYEAGSFDGYQDIYNYEPTPWTETFGDF